MNPFERNLMETSGQRPKFEIDLNLDKTLRLKASDVTIEYAEQNIQNNEHLINFMLVIFQKRADGGHSNMEQARSIEQMC